GGSRASAAATASASSSRPIAPWAYPISIAPRSLPLWPWRSSAVLWPTFPRPSRPRKSSLASPPTAATSARPPSTSTPSPHSAAAPRGRYLRRRSIRSEAYNPCSLCLIACFLGDDGVEVPQYDDRLWGVGPAERAVARQ